MTLARRKSHYIHFETYGDARNPPLLLIMGLALSSRAWDRLPEHLSKHFRVVAFDNRGTGRSWRGGVAYRMRDLADDARAVIEMAGIGSAHVFGISMGGMIAQELALRHPERVRSLALGCTFASFRKGKAPTLSTKLDLLLLNAGFATADRLARVLVSHDWHRQNPTGAADWIRRAERTSLRYATAQALAIARHHTGSRLKNIRVPTLVLTGDSDRLVPPENSEFLARTIPGARLLVLRGAGHCFPLEKEAETVRAVTEHVLTCESREVVNASRVI